MSVPFNYGLNYEITDNSPNSIYFYPHFVNYPLTPIIVNVYYFGVDDPFQTTGTFISSSEFAINNLDTTQNPVSATFPVVFEYGVPYSPITYEDGTLTFPMFTSYPLYNIRVILNYETPVTTIGVFNNAFSFYTEDYSGDLPGNVFFTTFPIPVITLYEDNIISSVISEDGSTLIICSGSNDTNGLPTTVYKNTNRTGWEDAYTIDPPEKDFPFYFGEDVATDSTGTIISITSAAGNGFGAPAAIDTLVYGVPTPPPPLESDLFVTGNLYSSQNIYLGTLNNPLFQLDLSTDRARKLTSTTWATGSDIRVKKDIESANTSICYNNIKSLQLKYFRWNYPNSNVDDEHMLGFIAQDAALYFPKSVTASASHGIQDFLTLDTDQIIKSMYGALQKTINDKELLEEKLETAQNDIDFLETRLSDLEAVTRTLIPSKEPQVSNTRSEALVSIAS